MSSSDSTEIATWSIDKEKNLLFMSKALLKWLGYSLECTYHSPDFLYGLIHGEDLLIFNDHMTKLFNGYPSCIEHRVHLETGETRWIRNIGIPILNKDKKILSVEGVIQDLTENRAAWEQLECSHSLFQKMVQSIDLAIWSYDCSTRKVSFISDAMERISGYSIHNFLDKCFWENIIYKDDVFLYEQMEGDVRRGLPYLSEYRIFHANGKLCWIQVRVIPCLDESGKLTRLDGAVVDITTRKTMEEALNRSEQRYKSLFEFNSDAICEMDLNGNIRCINSAGERITAKPSADSINHFSIIDAFGDEHAETMRIYFDKALQGQSQHYVIAATVKEGVVFHFDMKNVPIYVNNKIEGVFTIVKDSTKKKRMERELKESEERYRRLIELSPQPMVSHHNGNMIYINPAGLNLIGANKNDSLIGRNIYDFIHSDQREAVRQQAQELKFNGYIKIEIKLVRFDGQVIDAKATGIYDEKAGSVLTLIEDITESLKMEKALKNSEKRYRRLVELSPVAIAVYKEGGISYINPAGLKMLDLQNKDELISKKFTDWIHPNYREYVVKQIEHTRVTGTSSPYENKLITSNGRVIDVSMSSINNPHSSYIQLMFEDITVKKKIERKLLESEELNRQIIELSPEAIVLHSNYRFIHLNGAALRLFGVSSADEIVGKPLLEWVSVSLEYREKVIEQLDIMYNQYEVSPPFEEKIIRANGEIVDVEVVANTITYKGENARISLIRDIRDRKKTEQARKETEQMIRESEERYYRLQTSLDRFSHDLFGVMKISQLEQRLLKEVKEVLDVTRVKIVEVRNNDDSLCKIMETKRGWSLKIGEVNRTSYLLYIKEKPITLQITSKRVWLETICRYASVLFDNFILIEGLTKELQMTSSKQVAPQWLLRFMFKLSENERKHLAQDLHDVALQEQIIWYHKLYNLTADLSISGDIRIQLAEITQGLLDVIYQIRITCNELRPPLLMKEGLVSSLEALFEFTQLRCNYMIRFNAINFNYTLSDEVLIGMYRIAQEFLSNATKHSQATEVHIHLSSQDERIELEYEDNGVGMDLGKTEDSYKSMGIYGIKERVRSMDGTIDFYSRRRDKGLAVRITIPAHE